MKETIPIIIVNYNDGHLLHNCLESLLAINDSCKKNKLMARVMIIDNSSFDNSYNVIKHFINKSTKNIIFSAIWLPENVGFIKANNYGIKLGLDLNNVNFVSTLNPDTYISRTWLASLYKCALDSKDNVGMYASKINILEYENNAPITTEVRYNYGHTYHIDGACLDNGYNNKNIRKRIFCHCHAGSLLKSKMLEQCGFPDADYWSWYDCPNLGWKARLNGWDVVLVDNAKMWHRESNRRRKREFRKIVERNRILTILRYMPIEKQPLALHLYTTQNRSDKTTHKERLVAIKEAQTMFTGRDPKLEENRIEIYEKYCLPR